jgi:hypothetical protein
MNANVDMKVGAIWFSSVIASAMADSGFHRRLSAFIGGSGA